MESGKDRGRDGLQRSDCGQVSEGGERVLMTVLACIMIVEGAAAFCTGFCLGHDAAVVDWHIKTHREGRK